MCVSLLRRCTMAGWILFYIVVMTFVVALPLFCGDLPFSWYFSSSWTTQKMIVRADQVNVGKLRKAQGYFSHQTPSVMLKYHEDLSKQEEVDLAIGVVSVKRTHTDYELGYLIQVMAQTDQIFRNDKSFERKVLFICDTDAGPGEHVEANDLSKYFTVHKRFSKNNPSEAILDPFEKEKRDYIYCMQTAMKWKPKHVLILEDDALPHQHMFSIMKYKMDTLAGHDDWAYIKLYHPERWQGFSFEFNKAFELFLITYACTALTLGILRAFIPALKQKFPNNLYMYTALLVFAYYLLMFLSIGRPYIITWKRFHPYLYSLKSAPDCCTPAMVYRGTVVPDLVNFLGNKTCGPFYPLDNVLAEYTRTRSLKQYLIEPNLVKHIGMYSTVKSGAKFPEEFIN